MELRLINKFLILFLLLFTSNGILLATGQTDYFSITNLGDLDKDGISDIAVSSKGNTNVIYIMFLNSNGTVKSSHTIGENSSGFTGIIEEGDHFGRALAGLGDLDGDGFPDLVVGASGDDDGGENRGALWILFLNRDGYVKSYKKISMLEGNFNGLLNNYDSFGVSLTNMGDINKDGVPDLAAGTLTNNSVWILFLNNDGTIKNQNLINMENHGDFAGGEFGISVANIHDLDGDGISELAVGAPKDINEYSAVWILYLNPDGTAKNYKTIEFTVENFNFNPSYSEGVDNFGCSITPLGDLNNDGIPDIAVGDSYCDACYENSGSVWIIFLTEQGDVKVSFKLNTYHKSIYWEFYTNELFGSSLASLGDLDGDGINEIAVGVPGDKDGEELGGSLYILFLRPTGTIDRFQKISPFHGRLSNCLLDKGSLFGNSLASLGDLDGDGIPDIAVGAPGDKEGAVWILFLNRDGTVKWYRRIGYRDGGFTGKLDFKDWFGDSLTNMGDLDGDGVIDLAVGVPYDDDGDEDKGAIRFLFLNPDGTVKEDTKISSTIGNNSEKLFDTYSFDISYLISFSIASPGDLDNDSMPELLAGEPTMLRLISLNTDYSLKSNIIICENNFSSIANLGDINSDGITDFACGNESAITGGWDSGAVWIMSFDINTNTLNQTQVNLDILPDFHINEGFGTSIAYLGDINDDEFFEIAVGQDGYENNDNIWILSLNNNYEIVSFSQIENNCEHFQGYLRYDHNFGSSIINIGDLDGDGIPDLAVGAPNDSALSYYDQCGAVWILFLNPDCTVKSYQKISNLDGNFSP